MCKKISFFILFTLFSGSEFYAQKSEYNKFFIEGNQLMLEENYLMALESFLKAHALYPDNSNINYKVGYCYLKVDFQRDKALYYLERAVRNTTRNYDEFDPSQKKAPEIAIYYLAQAFQLQYKFKEANTFYERFKEMVGNRNPELSKEIQRRTEQNYNAIVFLKDTAKVIITNLGDSINSFFPEYGPVISADESVIIFTSRREGSTGGEKTIDNRFYEDIYISYKTTDGNWKKAKSIGENINSYSNEASISLSADGQQLFIYKDFNGGDIYYSSLEGENWSSPMPMGSDINSPAWEPSGCLSADGNIFYFVSNREGGFGGTDLYRCVKLPNGSWSKALNLGPTINTEYDEDAPFAHPDGVTLFFSSKGHKNMGGYDVFYSVKDEDAKWTTPINLSAPINTPDDDIFYVLSTDGKRAYYSSVKKGGLGEKDIYMITYKDAIVDPVTLLKGQLTFNGTDKIPNDVMISVTDLESGLQVQTIKPNSKTGKYLITLSPGKSGKTYSIRYEAEGYQPVTDEITIEPISSYQEIEKALELNLINFESKTPGTLSVSGKITTPDSTIIETATVIVKNNTTGILIDKFYTNNKGIYYFVLQKGENYNITYEAKGFLFRSENINIPNQPDYTELQKDIILEPVKVGAKIILNNIFFDSNRSILRKESSTELEKVLTLMREYPFISIEVSGHTDSKGKDEANLKLSQERAKAVASYLEKQGIEKNRIIAKGYGKTKPIAPNTLPNGKPNPEGMQQNRRVELKIIDQIK